MLVFTYKSTLYTLTIMDKTVNRTSTKCLLFRVNKIDWASWLCLSWIWFAFFILSSDRLCRCYLYRRIHCNKINYKKNSPQGYLY